MSALFLRYILDMRWISIKERLPAENAIVGVMAIDEVDEKRRQEMVDPRYSSHVYTFPKFFVAFYCREKNHSSPIKGKYIWHPLGSISVHDLADRYRIEKWCEMPYINSPIEIEKFNRWELLDL